MLEHWRKHGLDSTKDAFGVCERTLKYWKAKLKAAGGRLEALNPGSRAPKRKRRREWPDAVLAEIRRLRRDRPNLGKDKVRPLLAAFCAARGLKCPGAATVGNLIADMGGLRSRPRKVRHNGTVVVRKRAKVPRKPRDFVALFAGHCVALDTIERIVWGRRRYVITAIDLHTRFAFALAVTSHASDAARRFFLAWTALFPYRIGFVLTDNGSEFMKHFDAELRRLCLVHWRTYPRSPKMNAHCERFNRTIQEEFIDYHVPELLDIDRFNTKLTDWLVWYNAERPHFAFGNRQSPLQFMLNQNAEGCKMYLTHTRGCQAVSGTVY